MEPDQDMELLEIINRIQTSQSYNPTKKETVKVKIGTEIVDFPVSYIPLLPSQQQNHSGGKIESIECNLHSQNEAVAKFFSEKHYENPFKYGDETLQVWQALNKGINPNDQFHDIQTCFEIMEEKWERGYDNYNGEILFILQNIDEVMKNKDEEYIKRIPIDVYKAILQQLPENKRLEWMENIVPNWREDILKAVQLDAIGDLNVEKLTKEDFIRMVQIIKRQNKEMGWIEQIEERLEQQNEEITREILSEYEFADKIDEDLLENAFKDKKLKFIDKIDKIERVKAEILEIFDTFNFN